MDAQTRITFGAAALARPLLDPICDLYDEVFSAPPLYWRPDESALHRERLVGLLDDSSFGVAVALVGDKLVGFAYGFALPVDTKRWSRLVAPLPPAVTAEWSGRTFMLFDYAVRRAFRGKGCGRALHHGLLGSRAEERATLSVDPDATRSKQIYEHWGWHQVGQSVGGPTASAPLFDVYLRDRLDDLVEPQAKP